MKKTKKEVKRNEAAEEGRDMILVNGAVYNRENEDERLYGAEISISNEWEKREFTYYREWRVKTREYQRIKYLGAEKAR